MKKKVSFSEKTIRVILAGLLVLIFSINVFLAWRDSQTVDEGAHIAAGYSYVTTGDFRLNSEHPSLFKILAGLSILPLDTKPAQELDGWDRADQWDAGRDLLYSNPRESHKILFLARLPSIAITVLLVFSVFILGKKLFGAKIGLLAAALISVDPTLNGHGHLVTNDVFVALGAVLFVIAAVNYWRAPNRKTLIFLSLAVLLATSAKFSGAVFIPIGLLIVIFRIKPSWKRVFKHLAVAFAVLSIGLWLQYGFQLRSVNKDISQGYAQSDRLTKEALTLKENHPFFNTLFDIPIPAFSYFRGLATLAFHNGDGHPAYLYGHNSDNGWAIYFPIALSIKLPLVIIAFTAGGLLTVLLYRRRMKNLSSKKILLLVAAAGVFLALGMMSRINIGVRHVFGVWPFIYILAALFITQAVRFKNWRVMILVSVVLTIGFGLYGSIRTPIAYQNFAGNALETLTDKPVLIDSNRDWSQDLYRLEEYLSKRNVTEIGEAIFTSSTLSAILKNQELCSIDTRKPICSGKIQQLPCTLAVSDTARYLEVEEKDVYAWLPGPYELKDRVGGSISIYTCR